MYTNDNRLQVKLKVACAVLWIIIMTKHYLFWLCGPSLANMMRKGFDKDDIELMNTVALRKLLQTHPRSVDRNEL